jgi:tetratricopeptide (TPR) repeat protein
MIIIGDAWAAYPPAAFPSQGIRLVLPDSNTVSAAAAAATQNYIRSELVPKISAMQEQIRRAPSASLYNQLGNLLLRSGQIPQAKSAYETAAGMGLAGAMVNRGNIALNENDISGAERWFRQALAKDPQNRQAIKGMEFVEARK